LPDIPAILFTHGAAVHTDGFDWMDFAEYCKIVAKCKVGFIFGQWIINKLCIGIKQKTLRRQGFY